uniref:serine/threonine-protein kinase n=1 Tax=Piscicoccus intestinalis TaxID=746033 RepID=UPI0012EEA318
MDTTDAAKQPLGSAYLLGEVLGAGASGQVRAGTDREGNEYAVKLLHPSLAADPAVVRRFVAERDVLRAIRHPHVVAVTDLVIEGNTLAIVMERVDGGDLRDRLRESGTIAPELVAEWGSHIAAGLHAAHVQSVVHRDVKPENVLLDESHDPPAARLSDFGVARLLGEAHTGMLLGTPHYLAPELAQGAPATPAADLYALGITLYELACGHVPYAARRGPQAVLAAHVHEEPGRPLGVPDRLWEIIRALLEPDPGRRLAPAGRVSDELRAAAEELAGAPA